MISSVQNSTTANAPTSAPATSSTNAQQTQFLTMLTAQLKNQDPLNPMDNAQITSQLAALSTVTGINQLNTTLAALSNTMSLGASTSLIGTGVLVPSSALNLASGKAMGGVNLAGPADGLSVEVKDASGNTVQTLQLGTQTAGGVLPFAWDGSTAAGTIAPDGAYTFTAQATQSGAISTPPTLGFGTVNAITPGTSGVTVNVNGLGGFALSAIQQVY
jgi:flagellar basal-body rod modification protein FlgD